LTSPLRSQQCAGKASTACLRSSNLRGRGCHYTVISGRGSPDSPGSGSIGKVDKPSSYCNAVPAKRDRCSRTLCNLRETGRFGAGALAERVSTPRVSASNPSCVSLSRTPPMTRQLAPMLIPKLRLAWTPSATPKSTVNETGRHERHAAGEDAFPLRTNLPAGSPPQW
jgi:hypothetical protein